MKLQGNKTLYISKWFWIKNIILFSFFVYYVCINIIQPTSLLKYTWHYGIWFLITSYVVLWEGRKYFNIYKKLAIPILDRNTLVGLASHILYVFSIVMAILHYDQPMFSYPQMWEGAALLVIFTNMGKKIEIAIHASSLEAYRILNKLKNQKVIQIKNNKQIKVLASEIKIGDTILILKGEIVNLDGLVLSNGVFDYSNITGESKPINLIKNMQVISGAHNLSEAIKIKVTTLQKNSTLVKVVDNIERISMTKPPLQQLADKILKYFLPIILIIAISSFIIWELLINVAHINTPSWISLQRQYLPLFSFVSIIAIACPCALGMATPLVYAVSSTLATKEGIAINNPVVLEELSKIDVIAFDKTGTITTNQLIIDQIVGNKKYFGVAKALEAEVNHPIAKAILSINGKPLLVKNIKVAIGKYVEGTWKRKKVKICADPNGISKETTNIALFVDNKIVLQFSLKNEIREGVKEVITKLNRLNIETVMITGDNSNVANLIAKEVGIKKVFANCTPLKKANIIQSYQDNKKTIAFVGDGFNDIVAIKQADISMAFTSGSDITSSLSDVCFLQASFIEIYKLFLLSKINKRRVVIALTYALIFNIFCIPLAAFLIVQPWLAAIVMSISNILIAFNAYSYKKFGGGKLHKK